TEASRAIQSVQVTEAVRNATIGGKKVKQGQTIALDPDDGLVAVNGDRNKAVLAAVAGFKPGYELITLYYGADATLAEAEAMSKRIHDVVPAADVEVVHGGPAHYPYLISAEEAVAGPPARGATKAAPPKPVPTDPAELLETPVGDSGIAASGVLKRAGRRLGVLTVRDLLVHLSR